MTTTIEVAALYVVKGGCYFGLPGVDPWDEERDARRYAGPYPVVAHPPCERWGRYWSGGSEREGAQDKGRRRGMLRLSPCSRPGLRRRT